jgi:cytochrome c
VPADGWVNRGVLVIFTAADDDAGSGVAYTEYALDGGAWTKGTSCAVAGEGPHTVLYRSADAAGNVEADKTLAFGIDTVKPTTKAPSAASVSRGRTATLKYRVLDALPCAGTCTVTIKVKTRAGRLVKTLKCGIRTANTASALTAKLRVPRTWKKGTYRFSVYATDAAGNKQANVASNRLVVR